MIFRDADNPVVLFDGGCSFCNGTVRWAMRCDREARLRFAPLGSPAARRAIRMADPDVGPSAPTSVDELGRAPGSEQGPAGKATERANSSANLPIGNAERSGPARMQRRSNAAQAMSTESLEETQGPAVRRGRAAARKPAGLWPRAPSAAQALATGSSIVLVDRAGLHTESTAVLRMAHHLRLPWRSLALLVVVPRPVRDALYRAFAARRYRWFGRSDSCPLPVAAPDDS